jgi:hypothetical protein
MVVVFARVRSFGAFLARHDECIVAELFAPFLVGLDDARQRHLSEALAGAREILDDDE